MMIQFLADNIDQLDLALDQLAVSDRNFDRFAFMLIDNVVELTLHQYAKDKASENDMWGCFEENKKDQKIISKALGQNFDAKVRLARATGLLSNELADSILYLHVFRNTSYHRGLRHEGILHSLSIFYFQNACSLLSNYPPLYWCSSSTDVISHRAMKYLGKFDFLSNRKEVFSSSWKRLNEIAESMSADLIEDLSHDMEETIDSTDAMIQFLTDDCPRIKTRKQAVINSQSWPFAFTDEGKLFASKNDCPATNVQDHFNWITENYPWPVKSDPIPGWKRRVQSLKNESNFHTALKKYSDFLKQTEDIRSKIDESAAQLDAHIQHLIDVARGK